MSRSYVKTTVGEEKTVDRKGGKFGSKGRSLPKRRSLVIGGKPEENISDGI